MRKNNKLLAVILGYVNIIIHNLSTLILTPTMILAWGGSSYGLYKVILSLLTYFMLIDSGIRSTVIRFVSEYQSKQDKAGERRYIGIVVLYYLFAALLLTAIVFVFSLFVPQIYANSLSPEEIEVMLSALPLLLISTISALFFNSFSALLKGHNLQAVVQLINVIRAVLRFVVLLFMLKLGFGVTETIFAETTIAVVFAALVLLYVFAVIKLPPLFRGIDKTFVKSIVSFTSVMLVYTMSTSLFWSVGSFLVGVMTSTLLAAVYTTAITLSNMFQSLSGIISQVLVPDIMRKSFTAEDMSEMNSMMVRIARIKMPVMLLIVLGFALFGSEFVLLWVGQGYQGTYIIALMLMVPVLLGLLQDVPNNYILAKNKHKVLSNVTIIGCVINIGMSVLLTHFWGIYGAAFGTLITYLLINVVFTYWYYTKTFGFDMKKLYIETILKNTHYILFLIACGVAINFIPFGSLLGTAGIWGWIGFLLKVVLFTGIFLVVYLLGMADQDTKKKIKKLIGR